MKANNVIKFPKKSKSTETVFVSGNRNGEEFMGLQMHFNAFGLLKGDFLICDKTFPRDEITPSTLCVIRDGSRENVLRANIADTDDVLAVVVSYQRKIRGFDD